MPGIFWTDKRDNYGSTLKKGNLFVPELHLGTFRGNLAFMELRCRESQKFPAGGVCGFECASDINGCPRRALKETMIGLAKTNHYDDLVFDEDNKVKTALRHGGIVKRGQYIMHEQDVSMSSEGYCDIAGVGRVVARVVDNFTIHV